MQHCTYLANKLLVWAFKTLNGKIEIQNTIMNKLNVKAETFHVIIIGKQTIK